MLTTTSYLTAGISLLGQENVNARSRKEKLRERQQNVDISDCSTALFLFFLTPFIFPFLFICLIVCLSIRPRQIEPCVEKLARIWNPQWDAVAKERSPFEPWVDGEHGVPTLRLCAVYWAHPLQSALRIASNAGDSSDKPYRFSHFFDIIFIRDHDFELVLIHLICQYSTT